MILIKTLYFDDYEDFAWTLADKYYEVTNDDNNNSVDIIAKYDDAKEIICELIRIGYGIASITELADPDWDNYNDAYIISLYYNQIWCESAKKDDRYLFVEANTVYLFDDCNSKIIPKIESDEVYEVEIGECNYDCEDCDSYDPKHSSATYEVNGKEVSKKEYYDRLASIEQKYDKNIRSMMLDYCEFMDEVNEFRRLFEW